MKDFIAVKKPLEEEVVRDPVQVGRRTKENLRKSMISLLWHMLPSYLRWRVIWFYMVSRKPWETLGKAMFQEAAGKHAIVEKC